MSELAKSNYTCEIDVTISRGDLSAALARLGFGSFGEGQNDIDHPLVLPVTPGEDVPEEYLDYFAAPGPDHIPELSEWDDVIPVRLIGAEAVQHAQTPDSHAEIKLSAQAYLYDTPEDLDESGLIEQAVVLALKTTESSRHWKGKLFFTDPNTLINRLVEN